MFVTDSANRLGLPGSLLWLKGLARVTHLAPRSCVRHHKHPREFSQLASRRSLRQLEARVRKLLIAGLMTMCAAAQTVRVTVYDRVERPSRDTEEMLTALRRIFHLSGLPIEVAD